MAIDVDTPGGLCVELVIPVLWAPGLNRGGQAELRSASKADTVTAQASLLPSVCFKKEADYGIMKNSSCKKRSEKKTRSGSIRLPTVIVPPSRDRHSAMKAPLAA
ncbi:hypothetical protein GSI_07349 [Ganoderma sinense ZZ0214-1]|uniref:Uncharacterized protein n=1 Tax=Ganoderma sinense ZZ0214-1 TaxID=1077348 RepID=A0A2G8SA66_9APHY|nr:hypothetical protein GSI_07349 [Ganoderma sinense ZZ0214-1]